MEFLPLLCAILISISAVYVVIGWRLIKKGEEARHKKAMLTAAGFAIAFFIIYVLRTAFIGNTSFGGPEHIKIYYTIFLIFHIILSTTGGLFGVVTIRLALKGNYAKHRKIGPVTSVIWLFSAITGVAVYVLLYIFFPGGETTSLLKAIFGL